MYFMHIIVIPILMIRKVRLSKVSDSSVITQGDLMQVFWIWILLFPATSCRFLRRKIFSLWDSVWQVCWVYSKGQGSSDKGASWSDRYQGRLHAAGKTWAASWRVLWVSGWSVRRYPDQGKMGGVVWKDCKGPCLPTWQDQCWGTVWRKYEGIGAIDYPAFESLEESVCLLQ